MLNFMRKLSLILSITNLLLFLIPLIILVLIDFSNNHGVSKGGAIIAYSILNILFVIPAIVYVVFYAKNMTKFWFEFLMVLLNFGALTWLLPQFKAYIIPLFTEVY